MTTTNKGDRFEALSRTVIERLLNEQRLGIVPSLSRICHKPKYYSRDRADFIEVDISIEIWLPDAANYSMLWVFECKDYESTISVDQLEEFKAKLDQIAGKNVKGVFATRSNLQSGALTYARSNGIAVLRMIPEGPATLVVEMARGDLFLSEELQQRRAESETLEKAQRVVACLTHPFTDGQHEISGIINGTPCLEFSAFCQELLQSPTPIVIDVDQT